MVVPFDHAETQRSGQHEAHHGKGQRHDSHGAGQTKPSLKQINDQRRLFRNIQREKVAEKLFQKQKQDVDALCAFYDKAIAKLK